MAAVLRRVHAKGAHATVRRIHKRYARTMPHSPTISLSLRTMAVAVLLGLAVWFAPLVANFASLSLLAFILAAALVPVVDFCARHSGLNRETAVAVVFATMGLGALAGTLLLVPTVVEQIRTLAANFPQYLATLEQTLRGLQAQGLELAARFGVKGPPGGAVPDLSVLFDAVQKNASGVVGSGLGAAGKAISLLGMGAVVLMLAFFFLLEGPAMRAALLSLVPPPHRPLLNAQIEPITCRLGGYVQGMALGIAALAVYQVVVLSVLGLPLALALGLFSALMAIVPLVGGVLGVIPPALVALSVGWPTAIWALLLGYLGHFVVANFILPIVFSRSVQLSALTVTVALLVGSEAFGIFGALIAVPMGAAIQVLVQNLYVAVLEARRAADERDGLRFTRAPLVRLAEDQAGG